jgi:hypothetical protein
MSNIGTLFAFVLVSIGVIVLRYKDPTRRRGFRVPFGPVIPILSIIFCVLLMAGLPAITWVRFFVWLIIGLLVYFFYSQIRSEFFDGVIANKWRVASLFATVGYAIALFVGGFHLVQSMPYAVPIVKLVTVDTSAPSVVAILILFGCSNALLFGGFGLLLGWTRDRQLVKQLVRLPSSST